MKSWKKFLVAFGTVFSTVVVLAAIYFVSWVLSVGFVWIVFKLFGLTYSIYVATGIWLVWLVIRKLFLTARRG